MKQHIGLKWNDSSNYIGQGNGNGAVAGVERFVLFQPQFEAHHKIDLVLGPSAQGGYHRSRFLLTKPIGFKYFGNFMRFLFGNLPNLAPLARHFQLIMFGIALRRQIPAQSHGNRSRGYLGESRNLDELRPG